MRIWILATLAALPSFQASAESTVAIIGIGEDAALVGDLQRTVGLRIDAVPELERQPSADVAKAIGHTDAEYPTPDTRALHRRAQELLVRAIEWYYDGEAVKALQTLEEVERLDLDFGPLPATDRIAFHLWRSSVAVSLQDDALANASARAALAVDPELVVDLETYPPHVKERVDSVRAHGLRLATVVLQGLPRGASVRVDDRPRDSQTFQVPVGRHTLTVTAPGHRAIDTFFDVNQDRALAVELPLALEERAVAQLRALLRGQNGISGEVEALAARIGADAIVVLGLEANGTLRACVVRVGKTLSVEHSRQYSDEQALGDWIIEAVAHKSTVATRAPGTCTLALQFFELGALSRSGAYVSPVYFSRRTFFLDGALELPVRGRVAFAGRAVFSAAQIPVGTEQSQFYSAGIGIEGRFALTGNFDRKLYVGVGARGLIDRARSAGPNQDITVNGFLLRVGPLVGLKHTLLPGVALDAQVGVGYEAWFYEAFRGGVSDPNIDPGRFDETVAYVRVRMGWTFGYGAGRPRS